MPQASAEQVQTWNRQLRREGNPFRLRLTSQSPYLYLRGPFRDPPLIRTTGIHSEEANAARRAYELACEIKELRGALPAQLAPAHQRPGRRFSGWVMLVQATRQELARQEALLIHSLEQLQRLQAVAHSVLAQTIGLVGPQVTPGDAAAQVLGPVCQLAIGLSLNHPQQQPIGLFAVLAWIELQQRLGQVERGDQIDWGHL